MIIEAVCPSLNRPDELARLEASLPDGVLWRPGIETQPRALTTCVNELVRTSAADVVVVLADHIEVLPGCFDAIADDFTYAFPSLDGMVGLNITNMEPKEGIREYCFFAVGRKFLKRFPVGEDTGVYGTIFCPDYYHFSGDTELGEYAHGEGVFCFNEDAEIKTWHPNVGNAKRDDTNRASRVNINQDAEMRCKRKAAGYLWGNTFDLIEGNYG